MGSEALTYHERKALGFGTVKERVGKVRQQQQQQRRPPSDTLAAQQSECCQSSRHWLPLCDTYTTLLPPPGVVLQDSHGNYYDCLLTLQPAVVSRLGLRPPPALERTCRQRAEQQLQQQQLQ
jgi:hypothetical protein